MLAPGAIIGILGGGQLGRMLALAAASYGLRAHIYSPDTDSPAAAVAARCTRAAYDDVAALARFAQAVDVVTFEFENVPSLTAETLARHVPVRPSPRALAIGQDRVEEKLFASAAGLETARFAAVDSAADLADALAEIGAPALLKTRRLGYDGKGQALIRAAAEASAAYAALAGAPAILEAFVPFTREISVVLARDAQGAVAAYDPPWNIHAGGILRRSIVPSGLSPELVRLALAHATKLAHALDYVGVLAVEFFVAHDGGGTARLLFNEFAPRVHNSGHWTLDACGTSQFAQHLRAVAGWPLAVPDRHSDAVMDNLIGPEIERWSVLAGEPGALLHLYGKTDAPPGRKMGHVTRLYPLGGRPSDESLDCASHAPR